MTRFKALLIGLLFATNSWAVIPENGWWWNASESGRGFNLEIQNNLLFFASFAYDSNGNPAWYTAGGAMTSDRDWSAPLVVTARGQCFGCGYVAPQTSVVGTVTLHFTSSQTAILTINGYSISVSRFDFWANSLAPEAMLGEWSAVIGAASDIFDGERIDYTQRLTDSSGPYLGGSRLGTSPSTNPAIVEYNASLGAWVALLDSSTSYYRGFRFNTTGFNRVEGSFWIYLKTSTPSGNGTFYQAFRTASYALLTTGNGPGSTKREPLASTFDDRDAALYSEISKRQSASEAIEPELLRVFQSLQGKLETMKRATH